jgi:hypothetical protein
MALKAACRILANDGYFNEIGKGSRLEEKWKEKRERRAGNLSSQPSFRMVLRFRWMFSRKAEAPE